MLYTEIIHFIEKQVDPEKLSARANTRMEGVFFSI